MTTKLFKCQCQSPDHVFYIEKQPLDEDYENLAYSVHVHLSDIGFWYRLKTAFKYLFKIENDCAFDNIYLSKQQASELSNFLNS